MYFKYEQNIRSLCEAIDALFREKEPVIVAIDGRAASGKSTIAEFLVQKYGGVVVHADDFFLPVDMRSTERLAEPGGNIHYERMYDEVISHLKVDSVIEYGVFNCSTCCIDRKQKINITGLVIVEGAYSLHPKFGKYYDLSVFVSADELIRLRRVEERNGAEKVKIFKERWMPMEEKYISNFKIDRSADIILSTDNV